MTTYNEQEPMSDVSQRFVQTAEELRLSGRQLYRDGIVANDQVLSKIKNGWQKPTRKAIELFCQKYAVSAAWIYTGEGNQYLGRRSAFDQCLEMADERPFYNIDFDACLDSKGEPVEIDYDCTASLPTAGDIDFWCLNTHRSLAPVIMPGDLIALKRLTSWRDYIPGDFICVVVTAEYKVLRKVAVSQTDSAAITFTQFVEGQPVESRIPKDIILEIYKVVGNYRRQ